MLMRVIARTALLTVLASTIALSGPLSPMTGVISAQGRSPVGPVSLLDRAGIAIDEGRFSSARALVERWWEDEEAGADRAARQHGIWLLALLTVDPDAAETLYRRLVVEYPGGAWSDRALLRLASGSEARDDHDAAVRYLEIVLRDYPASPYRVEARNHLDRLGRVVTADAREPAVALAGATDATNDGTPSDAAAPDVVAGEPDATAPTAVEAETATADRSPDPEGPYTVQFGAFSTEERARTLARDLELAGVEVRVVLVEGSALFRVRTGAFADRAEADVLSREYRARGFDTLVQNDRERESPVGDD